MGGHIGPPLRSINLDFTSNPVALRALQSSQNRAQKQKKVRTTYAVRTSAILLQAKSLVETVNASTSINQLLLAGIEGVALRADFNLDVLLGGTGRKDVATGTADGGLFVLGMDIFLHVFHLFLLIVKGRKSPQSSFAQLL